MGYGLDPTGCIEREEFLELLRRGKVAGALKEARRIKNAKELSIQLKTHLKSRSQKYVYIYLFIYITFFFKKKKERIYYLYIYNPISRRTGF